MSLLDRFWGLFSAPAYALQRSKFAFLRLHIAAMLLGLLGAAYVVYRGWQDGFTLAHATLAVLCLLLVVLLFWADRRRYVVFRAQPALWTEAAPDLRPEEKLFLRGSGFFEVNKMRRYLVEVPVVFWTTELAEHIVCAKVRALNVLGVGVPSAERGWWYAFLEPRRISAIEPGELCFGIRLRPAVRVLYQTSKGREVLYLSCSASTQLAVLLKELQTKAQAAQDKHKPGF